MLNIKSGFVSPPWYNDEKGISSSVKNLDTLKSFLDRRESYCSLSNSRKNIESYVLYGRIFSGNHGEKMTVICKISGFFTDQDNRKRRRVEKEFYAIKEFPNISKVLTKKKFLEYLENHKGALADKFKINNCSIEVSECQHVQNAHSRLTVPSDHISCGVCNKGWNLFNLHDIVSRSATKTIGDLKDYKGKQIS